MTNLFRNKKVVIPAIIGLASIALVLTSLSPILAIAESSTNASMPQITGSVNVVDTMKNFIKENRKISLSEAASTAESQVTNGAAIGGHVGIEQGYLVYNFFVVDTESETGYNIVVDAGDGKVLYKSDGISLKEMGKSFGFGPFGHGSFGKHGFGEKWMMPHQGDMDTAEPQSSETQ